MKTSLVFTLIVAVMLVFAGVGYAQISGTDHDFSSAGWNSGGEICEPCHTPHNAKTAATNAPLWNHQITSATFTLYSGYDLDATMGQPDGSSKLCLSCHDGTVALENFGDVTNGSNYITGDALLGTDLSDDHPVSFVYNAALATSDGELHDPTNTNSGLGSTIDADMLDSNDKLQCASCHDPHDNTNSPFLIKTNAASALCLTCHDK